MKKIMTILLISLILVSSLSATSYIDKVYGDMQSIENANIGFTLSLSSLVATDIGFSSVAIESMTQKNDNPVVSKAFNVLNSDTGTLSIAKEDEFYMYWKLLGNPSKLPSIYVKVSGPMESAETSATVDWKASWADVNGTYNATDVVSCSNTPEDKRKKVFPDSNVDTSSNNLKSFCICKKVKIETLEPYWVDPAASYTAKLWLEVQGL